MCSWWLISPCLYAVCALGDFPHCYNAHPGDIHPGPLTPQAVQDGSISYAHHHLEQTVDQTLFALFIFC